MIPNVLSGQIQVLHYLSSKVLISSTFLCKAVDINSIFWYKLMYAKSNTTAKVACTLFNKFIPSSTFQVYWGI